MKMKRDIPEVGSLFFSNWISNYEEIGVGKVSGMLIKVRVREWFKF